MKFYYALAGLFLVIGLLYVFAKRNDWVKQLFSKITIVFLLIYLVWRLFFTIPLDSSISLVFGVILYVAEFIGLFVYGFFIYLFSNKLTEDYAPSNTDNGNFEPSVAAFICTYNENIKLVIATALAVKALKYPNKKIYICDDGHRDELRKMADQYNLGYLSREGNKHAKAGNINYALSQTSSDLILLLDADFIVKKNIIYEAINYFQNPKVALVQYPQTFYNKDPFQLLRKSFYNEQELFMRFLEPALARENALIHIGTNAIIRRSALEEIGGIPTKSITEDMATGMLLQNAGYETIFINKAYALGITPYTAKELASQRTRWAQGTKQIFDYFKPRKLKGLSVMQKLCYYNSYLYWFTSFQKIIFLLAPTLFMVFDIFIVRSNNNQLLLFFLPPFVMISLSFRLYVPKIRNLTTSHIYDCFVAPIHTGALLKEFLIPQKKFNVTKKELVGDTAFDWRTVAPHIIIFGWILFSCIVAAYRLFRGEGYEFGYIITLIWSIYNLYGLFYAIILGKNRDIESDSEALSIVTNRQLMYASQTFEMYQMSFNGFRIRAREGSLFVPGNTYVFIDKKDDLTINSICRETTSTYQTFSFENLTSESAEELASYYSDQLNAAKQLEFDMEDELPSV
ncbi:glycosyltransferase [Enterococcus faecium]|uniref:Glycosyltransferase n=1 Tax=Enterococcus faecium TaxID=1352 RepID=A0A7V7GKZ2_ENTFC|nr:glycosyltransferase [Enterococcus faecium]EGP4917758.1 glycosyltransferase [Enterococcus faecium]EGP4987443.1 glycosyltransferase [Enterococcus faecium]EGP5257299.1 glycosyltransferase [Enterococcus faecium]EGP5747317.1 glycosyltransferase [Enterococcus faecium]EME3506665.1 glycosyltransferase [Enterococcus faecium]